MQQSYVDAACILRFAAAMQPHPGPARSPVQLRFADLVRRRRQLVDAAASEKQLEPSDEPLLAASAKRHLACLAGEIEELDQAIRTAIETNQTLARRTELLRTIPGVGAVTAAMLEHNRPWKNNPA